jgi:hypothetical protein
MIQVVSSGQEGPKQPISHFDQNLRQGKGEGAAPGAGLFGIGSHGCSSKRVGHKMNNEQKGKQISF